MAVMVFTQQLVSQQPQGRKTLAAHAQSVFYVSFDPNGKRLASASSDKTI
jgi:hypothetical protein